ncbi:MAG TPA: hypothetical protein VMW95_06820 [Desulfobacterales bacterium]|nr:hypothetical protein [Desulfobacterales bacterium]
MRDFTLTTYKKLLQELLTIGYSFQTLQDFIQRPEKKTVILRHDVDRKPGNTLVFARIEKQAGMRASYYFRIVKESYDENIIRQIADMGHEIGYHYENLSLCRGNYELAIINFELDLEKLRKLYPVKTICMHGSPLSKLDNRELWKKYIYRDFGIIAEPYFDINWQKMFYLTDTGRKWNNTSSSVRDKVDSGFNIAIQSTSHLIALAEQNALPHQVMINTHPQRWTNNPVEWAKELVWQNLKNVIKKYFYVRK